MKRQLLIILPALCASLLTAPAVAGDGARDASDRALQQRRERLHEKRERQFREADTDNSRSLTRAEIEAGGLPRVLLRRFDEVDSNGDGVLSPEELEALEARRVQAARGDVTDD